ncbi:DnaA-homolog protein [Bathymodiolus platifrons methanotrophic gill symbiont]|uniref:DnaA regulatory inactivator Hda n=1 Tax=Bathymodiolus platifrons methanotrophic gill symbiont TaxID=113268 RepID=UPI000B410F66|nr:DnaA regulatory inactivator Hda [Bathymodiolus platifrons methanotrophic gill symbiont]MCK5870052.1 DnaA regulatory inactivator Hda [Methyloprofundus sp.]TXK97155.1 DnaA regulatory inactivator Hda [Methylococcaceae bacterium CS4]TXL01155.1 DnaA regulatory inactivator Hda [Methylococcaceae bacterium CS5]TXL07655.1 DnaA regulatory inactivator Hda [Methylococcaceae bacterium CS3]TXL07738.1 DnaA regulatory inactivator Hda [Methylococcaceae bacterium CS1]TXL10392.1 DnaA regulatory inactivator H
MAEQIPIQFDLKAELSFASFYTASHQETIQHLTDTASGEGEQQLYLWGKQGAGKSHLLQACCLRAHQRKLSAFYLPLESSKLPAPDILKGLDTLDLICIDNIELCAGNSGWESALFNFYNQQRENNHQLIISANCPPNYLAIELPDLKTRMNWGLTLKLQELSDAEQIAALTFKAKNLGFEISPQVGNFLSKNYARDLPELWSLLPRLEQATLIAKRKLTVPFLKQILAEKL